MATLDQLQNALVAADKAGATDDARQLAQAIIALKSKSPDAPTSAPEKPVFEDPGIAQSALIGAGRTFDRIGKGMQQIYYGATGNDKAQAELSTRAADDDKTYQPLKDARPFATGIGEGLPSMVIPGGGAATLIGNAGRMAMAGAAPAMLEYGDAGERLMRGMIAGASGAALPLLGAVAKSAKSFAEPLYDAGRKTIVGRTLNRVAGADAANVINRMQTAKPLISGSIPTAAEVAENGGIAAMQRAASQANPSDFTTRLMEQSSARLGALRGIAGDDAALAAAKSARQTSAKPLYDAAKSQSMRNTPELGAILDSLPPSVMGKAHSLAMLAREPLKSGVDVPAHTLATGILDASGQSIGREVAAQSSSYSGKALHYIKMAMDDALEKTGEGALGRTEKALMTNAKDDFLKQVNTGIPAYGQASAKFAEMSKPVNQMQVGQALLDKLKPALSDYGALGQESKAVFANALRGGDKLASDVTKFKGATMDGIMSPTQIETLNNIAQDLARKTNAENLGKGVGSDTFQKLAMQNIAEQSGMPRLVGGLLELPGVSRATKWVYRDTDDQAKKIMAEAMLDPKKAAQLMQAAKQGALSDSPKLRQLLEQSIMRPAGLLGSAALTNE